MKPDEPLDTTGPSGHPRRVADGPSPAGQQAGDAAPGRVAGRPPGFGVTVGWTVLGSLIPGLGLWRAGRRTLGPIVLAAFVGMLGVVGAAALQPRLALAFVATPAALTWLAVALVVVALGWVGVIGATYLAWRPAGPTAGQRVAGAVLVTVLSLAVTAPMALAVDAALATSRFLAAVFDPDDDPSQTVPTITNPVDPWAEKDRLNVLILGGDSGTGRQASLGLRTDSVIVASIDTHSGKTTLLSLPRQTARMPFPAGSHLATRFPSGWYDGVDPLNSDYWLNAMYRFAPEKVDPTILGKTKHLAEDIMKVSVGEALGLDIDYFLTINLDGAKNMITALGGVTVNVNSPLPIGGDSDRDILPTGWIEPGPNQHLGGRLALWYGRGRWGYLDYDRMSRQRCLINAVVHQASPQNVLLNFQKIAAAGEDTISTDLPESMVVPVVELAERVKGTPLASMDFVNGKNGFSTTRPDWEVVRGRVAKALRQQTEPSTSPSASSTPKKPSTRGSRGLDDECGYHPNGFIPKGYPATRDNPRGR